MQLPGHPGRGPWLLSARNNRDFDADLLVCEAGRDANCGGIRSRWGRKPTPRSQKSTSRNDYADFNTMTVIFVMLLRNLDRSPPRSRRADERSRRPAVGESPGATFRGALAVRNSRSGCPPDDMQSRCRIPARAASICSCSVLKSPRRVLSTVIAPTGLPWCIKGTAEAERGISPRSVLAGRSHVAFERALRLG